MNKTDFLNIIGDSSRIDRMMLGEIQELLEIFPYFQSAHLLLLKGLQKNADVKFDTQLKSSAIHIADREVLYYFLNNLNISDQASEIVTDVPGNESAAEARDSNPDIITDEIHARVDDESTVNKLTDDLEPSSAVSEKQDEPGMPGEADPADHIPVDSVQVQDNFEVLSDSSEEDRQEDQHTPGQNDTAAADTSELLELDINGIEEPQAEIKETLDSEYIKKKLQAELIDRFIIANPRIEPVREKAAVPLEDISKPSAEENGGFVTETLARIYVGQGYYSKAIDIYEKLSLKFPEKSSYFATQIEKVKEHLKN